MQFLYHENLEQMESSTNTFILQAEQQRCRAVKRTFSKPDKKLLAELGLELEFPAPSSVFSVYDIIFA